MMTFIAVAGWGIAAFTALAAIVAHGCATEALDLSGETVTRLYADNCTVRDTIADRDAVIQRQANVIAAKDKELKYIGVRRNAKGRLESIKP